MQALVPPRRNNPRPRPRTRPQRLSQGLNLDPRLHLQSSLPVPVVGPDTVSMSFYGASPGITYAGETSEDLQTKVPSGLH